MLTEHVTSSSSSLKEVSPYQYQVLAYQEDLAEAFLELVAAFQVAVALEVVAAVAVVSTVAAAVAATPAVAVAAVAAPLAVVAFVAVVASSKEAAVD